MSYLGPKTIFCDIDGTLIEHDGNLAEKINKKPELLKGVLEKFNEWDRKCYNIILTTGRKESNRSQLEKQLSELGIFYDKLIMGLGGGIRVLINDLKPNNDTPTAVAINLERNKGLENIEV